MSLKGNNSPERSKFFIPQNNLQQQEQQVIVYGLSFDLAGITQTSRNQIVFVYHVDMVIQQ